MNAQVSLSYRRGSSLIFLEDLKAIGGLNFTNNFTTLFGKEAANGDELSKINLIAGEKFELLAARGKNISQFVFNNFVMFLAFGEYQALQFVIRSKGVR